MHWLIMHADQVIGGVVQMTRSFNVEVQWWSRRIVHLGWGLKAMSLSRPSIEIRCDLITSFLSQ